MKNVILEARKIKKSFDQDQVLNLDIVKVYEAAFNFLLGPNGSGKTTLLNILSMVDTDYQGEVFYRGQLMGKQEGEILEFRRRFSVIWQNPYLFKGTVKANIGLPLKFRKSSPDIIEEKVKKMADKLDISHLLAKRSGELSGGERQKVSIARALITEPEVLFIDEPNTSLDYESSRYFNGLFSELVADGVTVLLITHDLYQIQNLADYITVLNDGKVVNQGTSEQVDF